MADQLNQPQKLSPKVSQPPSNLPQADLPRKKENVPERGQEGPGFSQKAAEKIPSNPKLDRYGEPSDLIPKNLPVTEEYKEKSGKSEEETKIDVREKEKNITPKKALEVKKISGKEKNEYEGPSIEVLERKNLIKKAILIVIGGVILILGGIFVYNKWFRKPVIEEIQTEVLKEEPRIEEDIDEDGIPNDWEEKHGLNPEDSKDADQDPDFDRLTNKREYEFGTDPKKSDTDDDGYKDGEEVQGGFNPNGPGKLSDSNNKANYFPTIKGTWQGTWSGLMYKSETFEVVLQSNGNLSGKLNSEILNLEEGQMESELSGVFDYKKETNVFTSKIIGNAAYKKGSKILTRGEYTLNLEGTSKDSNKEISGTWVIKPISELFWLKQDRGNFLLKKISEF